MTIDVKQTDPTAIPNDEMLLAEMIAYCEDRDLKGDAGAFFRSSLGYTIASRELVTRGCKVCAAGALMLMGRAYECAVVIGNDTPLEWAGTFHGDEHESLGWAFRNAMDPTL